MKLSPDWKQILRKAWSIRLAVLATLFSLAQVVIPIYADVLPRDTFAVLTAIATVGVIVARIVWQQDV